ncbi:PREDICTED: uncharacterized protein LOC109210799 [Nicotiana attenuata]|uniref:uncharacterized protein LOC109210799 n=1 Tax=Nicotiana attenuata TaxID=49451 RepID=UPI000904A4A6|nr:PREDICTED: uncharacterized protein LOC109210799 [Nicotiana attenuata]
MPPHLEPYAKKKFLRDVRSYVRDEPFQLEKNSHVNAVPLRNGRELVEVPQKKKEQSGLGEERVPKPVEVDERNTIEPEQKSERAPPAFPQRLRKKNDDHMFHKFLDMLKQIHLNIPLVDMLREVPKYAKYIKDIVANKRRIQHKLPQNLKDPGSFTIPVRIGEFDVGRALCDLDASINMMSLSVFKQLGLEAPRTTTVMLQLADRSYAYLEGVIEDVLLQSGKCEETNPVLNCKKCHFMVREGIMLGHKVSKDGLEVDKDRVEEIERLLEKDVSFKFDDACLKAIEELKKEEFDLEIRDRKGTENQVANHLSRLETRNHVTE